MSMPGWRLRSNEDTRQLACTCPVGKSTPRRKVVAGFSLNVCRRCGGLEPNEPKR